MLKILYLILVKRYYLFTFNKKQKKIHFSKTLFKFLFSL
ncbi:hypothetical protein LEP1GSC186_0355 [Leptospira noguchii serovar Autumnalis str. ZUN142]|uniref:Uncharacterized protein n=1 Tax=Leptospira noguchii serovar Autumnalis str. ZUN142 TaxID=1085540 RepID=M6UB64_9LEPT|nr:hypothetical protein LEP1GSC186_0355 [Leptospira noguchii serovar Autumnalis str. ZUN142]